jgi:hypothetical protein
MVNTFENVCMVGDNIYFFSYEVNALFMIDMAANSCEYIGSLKKYDNKIRLFGDLVYANGKLILVPTSADDFVIYNLEEKTEKYIPIRECIREYYTECKFFAAIPLGADIYFIGCHYPAIVKLNLITEEVTYYTDWLEEIGEKEQAFFRHDYCIENDTILLACSWTNKVMAFDVKNEKCSFFEVGSKERKYAGITYDGEYYWLTPFQDNIIVRWNRKSRNYEEIVIQDGQKPTQEGLSYAQSFMIGQYIIILPLYAFPVCIIDAKTGTVKTIDPKWVVKKSYIPIAPIKGGFVYKDSLYVINSLDGKVYFLDVDKMCFYNMSLDFLTPLKKFMADKKTENKWRVRFDNIVMEDTETDLDILLRAIQEDMSRQTKEKTMPENTVGKNLYIQLRR